MILNDSREETFESDHLATVWVRKGLSPIESGDWVESTVICLAQQVIDYSAKLIESISVLTEHLYESTKYKSTKCKSTNGSLREGQ